MSTATPTLDFSAEAVTARKRTLYQAIAKDHPSLLKGHLCCGRCGKSRRVDPVKLLHGGWSGCPCKPKAAAS